MSGQRLKAEPLPVITKNTPLSSLWRAKKKMDQQRNHGTPKYQLEQTLME